MINTSLANTYWIVFHNKNKLENSSQISPYRKLSSQNNQICHNPFENNFIIVFFLKKFKFINNLPILIFFKIFYISFFRFLLIIFFITTKLKIFPITLNTFFNIICRCTGSYGFIIIHIIHFIRSCCSC